LDDHVATEDVTQTAMVQHSPSVDETQGDQRINKNANEKTKITLEW